MAPGRGINYSRNSTKRAYIRLRAQEGNLFPERWTDQDIADAIAATIEHPELIESRTLRRIAYRQIDGVMVTVQ